MRLELYLQSHEPYRNRNTLRTLHGTLSVIHITFLSLQQPLAKPSSSVLALRAIACGMRMMESLSSPGEWTLISWL